VKLVQASYTWLGMAAIVEDVAVTRGEIDSNIFKVNLFGIWYQLEYEYGLFY